MSKRVLDLFAGGGGLSLGFQKAGFDVVGAIENWDIAADIYAQNFTTHPVFRLDLSDTSTCLPHIQKLHPEIIVGGPPCQDFSSAGKRDENQGRASLTVSFAEIIKAYRPPYFVMENVDRAVKSKAYAHALEVFRSQGYGLSIQILDASLCGAPQQRKRLFVIGSLTDIHGFLDDSLINGQSDAPMTLRKYFRGHLNFEHYYRHPRSYARRGIFSIDEPSPTIRGVNRPIPKGYLGHPGDSSLISPELRCLTTAERARIQTFPANFKWIGSKTDVEQVIGNAVPVKLAQYVANCLMKHIESQTVS